MSELEQIQFKEYKKFLRLSSERDLYTIPQAAFRMNVSRSVFEKKFVNTGMLKLKIDGGKKMVPKSELIYAIDRMQTIVHRNTLRQVQGSKFKF